MDYIKLFQTGNKFHTEPTDAIQTPQVFLGESMPLPPELVEEPYQAEVAPMDGVSVKPVKLPETKQLPKVAQHLRKLQQQYPELTEEQLQAKYDEISAQLQTNAQLNQGRTQKKTPIEEQQSQLKEKQMEVQQQAQTDAEKKAEAMKAASAMLQFISPSTWVEVMGNVDMTGAQELLADIFLDPTTYLSAGTLPLLKVATKESAEKVLKEAAERGLREGAEKIPSGKGLKYYQIGDDFQAMTEEAYKEILRQDYQTLPYYARPNYQGDALELTKQRLANGGFDRLENAALDDYMAWTQGQNDAKYLDIFVPRILQPDYRHKMLTTDPILGTFDDVSKQVDLTGYTKNAGGVGSFDEYYTVFSDGPQAFKPKSGKNADIAHEYGHFVGIPTRKAPGVKPEYKTWAGGYFDESNNQELLERFSQLKNFFGLKEGYPITKEMWEFAKKHYRHYIMDNDMTEFFDAIEPSKLQEFLNWGNKYAKGIAVPVGVTTAVISSSQNSYKNKQQ